MADYFADENGVGCFNDQNGVTCFVDQNGNLLCCQEAVSTITRGKSPQRGHTYSQSDWYLIR